MLRDRKKEKDIDSKLTSPILHSLLVTASQKGFGKTRKGTEKNKKGDCNYIPASRHTKRLNTLQCVEKTCLMIDMTEKTMIIHHFSYQRTNEHTVKLSASKLKKEVFFTHTVVHLFATRYHRHHFEYS